MTSDSETPVRRAAPAQLVALLDQTRCGGRPWRPEELGALLQHQLTAPFVADLSNLPADRAQQILSCADVGGLLLKSYGDLFQHPRPPLDLLRLVKDYAKAAHAAPGGPLPPEISQVLYYASIAAALVRWGERITSMGDAGLGRGLAWVREQPWVDAAIRDLMAQALTMVARHE